MNAPSSERRRKLLFGIFWSLLPYFRSRRIRYVYRRFPWTVQTRILDIGGNTYFWELAKDLGLPSPQVTVVNLYPAPDSLPANITWVVADGTNLPFRDRAFDIAFSNSVIEHLGNRASQRKMAQEIERVADRYFVQTPNKWFPLEPHYITPFIHWAPPALRVRLARNFTVWGLITRPTADACRNMVNEIQLLGPDEMRELFPKAHIVVEHFCGLPKSILALGAR